MSMDLDTATAIADTLTALSSTTELIAERVSQLDGRVEDTLKLIAAAAGGLDEASSLLAAHGGRIRNLEARLEALEARQDRTASTLIDHLAAWPTAELGANTPMCQPETHVSGPGPEHSRELAESLGRPWPAPVAITRATNAVLAGRRRAAEQAEALRIALAEWTCPVCGGPRRCPDLASTLAYRACGYREILDGSWVHA